MLTADEILLEGETLIGHYYLEIARWRDGTWSPTLPPLYTIITDLRLVLQPHSRKNHEPAVIPARYITQIQEFTDQFRHGMLLHLSTGHRIALFIPNHQREEIVRNMRTIAVTPVRSSGHEMHLDLGSLKKLIDFVSNL